MLSPTPQPRIYVLLPSCFFHFSPFSETPRPRATEELKVGDTISSRRSWGYGGRLSPHPPEGGRVLVLFSSNAPSVQASDLTLAVEGVKMHASMRKRILMSKNSSHLLNTF